MTGHFQHLAHSPEGGSIVLVAQAGYHLGEFLPLRDALMSRGRAGSMVAPVPPPKPLNRFRPGVRRFRDLLSTADVAGSSVETIGAVLGRAQALVVMNDWGVCRPLVVAASERGCPTVGWVEGVQDFADVDTGRERHAYRTVDHVLCLGNHDFDQLAGSDRTIVGSNRLRQLWKAPAASPIDRQFVTINSNFTYGVFPKARRPWVKDAVGACRSMDIEWGLSRHVAERGVAFPYQTTSEDVSRLLARSSLLISRFSTLGYEALVRGVGLAYHNPHGERVDTFPEVAGAIWRSTNRAELQETLAHMATDRASVRAAANDYLHYHLCLDGEPSPAQLAADAIERLL